MLFVVNNQNVNNKPMKLIWIAGITITGAAYGQQLNVAVPEGMRVVEYTAVSAYPPCVPCDDSLITSGAYIITSISGVSENPPFIAAPEKEKVLRNKINEAVRAEPK